VQLLTIAALLDNTQRAEHPDYEPDLNFRKAKAEAAGEQHPCSEGQSFSSSYNPIYLPLR
jgi:hypothetical protein